MGPRGLVRTRWAGAPLLRATDLALGRKTTWEEYACPAQEEIDYEGGEQIAAVMIAKIKGGKNQADGGHEHDVKTWPAFMGIEIEQQERIQQMQAGESAVNCGSEIDDEIIPPG